MMRVFLTGGTGFLGSHFAELAVAEGAEVVSLVRKTSITMHLDSLGVTLCMGDLRNVESLALGIKGCDAVIHAASPIGFWGKPELFEEITVRGTRNVIEAMKSNSVKTLIHISTISVHGLDPIEGKYVSETDGFGSKFLPYDHYGKAKVEAEKIIKEAHAAGQIQATVLRPGIIYGPRDNTVYGMFADMIKKGVAFKFGNGENRIPLVFVGNVARAIWLSLVTASPSYRVYLYASDGIATQNDYYKSLTRATHPSQKPIPIPKGLLLILATFQENLSALSGYRIPGFLTRYAIYLFGSDWHFDQSCIEKELAFTPEVNYEKGFALTEEWYREARSNQ
jgi:nucleoside-diphosphate-sugar epimerase